TTSVPDHFIARIDGTTGTSIWAEGLDAYHDGGDISLFSSGPRLSAERSLGAEYIYTSGMFENSEYPTMVNTLTTTHSFAGYLGKRDMCECQPVTRLNAARSLGNPNEVALSWTDPTAALC